jgi:hypothetical protein
MTGLIPDDPAAPTPRMKDGRTCIDPEALALAPDGSLYVTDEYGPYVYQFRADGTMLRRIELPKDYAPVTASGALDFTDAARLVSGRNINQGPEGMAMLPDGSALVLAFQSGLVQDGGHRSPTTRLLVIDIATGQPLATYLYPFATAAPKTGEPLAITDLSVNDIIALSPTRFLVLERDRFGRTGSAELTPPKLKAVWLADASKATNLTTTPATTPVPVTKSLVLNLPDIVPDPAKLAAKWEGIALLPGSTASEVVLMMTADNDFLTPVIHHDGVEHPFPRAVDSVPTQFYKIRATLP